MALTNGAVEVIDLLGGVASLAVAGVTVVWPITTYQVRLGVTYSIEYQFASPGTVECDIYLEQGNTPPATAGAASTDMVIPTGTSVATGIASKLVNIVAYTPGVTKFLRGRIAGTGANNAGTTLTRLKISAVKNV